MTRRSLRLAPALALALCAAGALTPAAGSGRARGPVSHLLVYAQEWSLYGSRSAVPAGSVVVQLWDRGQDAHNLEVRLVRHGAMTGRAQSLKVTQSGRVGEASWHLGPGRYELYCSLPQHLRRGMHMTLLVR